MMTMDIYKKRLRELEDDPLVREYVYIQKIIRIAETTAYKMRLNDVRRVIPEDILELDKIEKEEENVILKLLRWIGKASSVTEINKAYDEFYFEEVNLKYKIRHQFKSGNIYILSYNESRKYSFYVMPEWLKDGKIAKKHLPNSNDVPLVIDSIKLKSYDDKINKEML